MKNPMIAVNCLCALLALLAGCVSSSPKKAVVVMQPGSFRLDDGTVAAPSKTVGKDSYLYVCGT